MKLSIKLISATLTLSCLFTIQSPAHAEVTEPVRIGAILHLTGDLAMQGSAFREGIELAANEINSSGGINGRTIEIIYEDTHFMPVNVNKAAKKLLETDKVVAALISTFHESKTAGPLFQRAKVPLLCLWDSTPELEAMGDYIFSIGTWMPSTGKKVASYAFSTLKAKRAAVVSTNREWSLRVSNDFAERFSKAGGDIVSKDAYNPGETDFRSLFLRIKKANPDVIYAPVDDNIGSFFKQLYESGIKAPVIQSDNLNQEWIDTLGGYLEGVYQSHSIDPNHSAAVEMSKYYQKHFSREPKQLLLTSWGYDGLKLIAKALKDGEVNSNEIKKGLYDVKNYSGASGEISISSKGSNRVAVSMFQIEKGQFVLRER